MVHSELLWGCTAVISFPVAYITPTNMSYVVTEEQQSVDVCFNSELSIWLTVNVVTKDNTAVGT